MNVPSSLQIAIWNGNIEQIKNALKNGDSVETRDLYGNRSLHFALKCAHENQLDIIKILIENGARIRSRDGEGWTTIHHAITTNNEEILYLLLETELNQFPLSISDKANAASEKVIDSIPDLYCEIQFDINSWVPLLSRILPSDIIKIWKGYNCIRIDLTLVGFEKLSWQRGNISILYYLLEDNIISNNNHNNNSNNNKFSNCNCFILDHDKKIIFKGAKITKTLEKDIDKTIHFLLTNKNILMDFSGDEIEFIPSTHYLSNKNIIQNVGKWENTILYEMKNLVLLLRYRPARDPNHKLVKKLNDNDLNESHDEEKQEDNFSNLFRKITLENNSIEIKAGSDYIAEVKVSKGEKIGWVYSTEKNDISFLVQFYYNPNKEKEQDQEDIGKSLTNERCHCITVVPLDRVLSNLEIQKGEYIAPENGRLVFKWDNTYSFWKSKQLLYNIYPLIDDETGENNINMGISNKADNAEIIRSVGKQSKNIETKTVLFEEWFQTTIEAIPDNLRQLDPKDKVEIYQPLEHKTFKKYFSGTVHMCDNFPISVKNFLPIIQVLSKTSEHFKKVQDFFKTQLPVGFPVKFTIPVLPSISATLSFLEMKTDVISNKELFIIPEDYHLKGNNRKERSL